MNIRALLNRLTTLSLLIYLGGCNSSIGRQPNESNARNMVNRNISASQIAADDDKTSYEGSQAYNSSLFTSEDVNGQTGTLTLSKPLILSREGVTKDLDLSLNLVYSSSATNSGISGLPIGWDIQLSYVVPDVSVNIDGSNYVIDYNWHDASGYYSGLKYINNHAVAFKKVSSGTLKDCNDSGTPDRAYQYVYRGINSSHKPYFEYFDSKGKLLARTNNYGRCNSYYYDDSSNKKLKSIIDSNGSKYQLSYDSNTKLTVLNPDNTKVSINYNTSGITSYTDAMNYTTYYGYRDYRGKRILNQITYPSKLITQISYKDIMYATCSNQVGYLPAVSSISHTSKGGAKILNSSSYDYGTKTNANFTGYGYGGGYCFNNKTDSLADSNNTGFRYDVTITKNGGPGSPSEVSRVYYNFMHLPMEQDNLNTNGDVLSKVEESYDIASDPKYRVASFSSPIETNSYQKGVLVSKQNNSYDVYNQPTTSTTKILRNGSFIDYTSTNTNYFDGNSFFLVKDTTDTDLVKGKIKKVVNTLTSDGRDIQDSSTYDDNKPWKKLSYGYESTTGRLTSQTLAWLQGSEPSSTITDKYSYNKSSGILTDARIDARGYTTLITKNMNLPGSPVISETDPLGNTKYYSYDYDGREKSVTSPMGRVTTTRYQVAQNDGVNTVTKTDPLHHATTITYNELSQVVKVTDNGDNKVTRIIQQNSYYPSGKLQTTSDKLGNVTSYTYDTLGRELSKTDSLGNKLETIYDDAKLTTTSILNGNKVSEEVSDGVGNKLQTSTYSLATTGGGVHVSLQKNSYDGFKQNLQASTLVDGNLVKSTTTSYNGDGDAIKSTDTLYSLSNSSNAMMVLNNINTKNLLGKTLVEITKVNGVATNNSYNNTYYPGGLLKTSSNSLGPKHMTYDDAGHLKTVTNFDGKVTSYDYDGDGHVIKEIRDGVIFTKTYDDNGNLTSISDSSNANSTINYTYNATNQLTSVGYPNKSKVIYSYDSNGLLSDKTNALGVLTHYDYDSHGRIVRITTKGSILSYSYDDNGALYPQKGKLSTLTLTNGNNNPPIAHTYKYDGYGNIASDIVTQGTKTTTITYHKDLLQRTDVEKISSNLLNESGVLSSNLNLTKHYSYDSLNQLTQATTKYTIPVAKVESENYTYDTNGNITSFTTNESTTTYEYNTKDQLISITTANATNKLITPVTVAIKYDAAGNMLNDASGNVYSYNSLNQLEAVTIKATGRTTRYSYYADGLLGSKVSNDDMLLKFYYDNSYKNPHVDGITSSNDVALNPKSLSFSSTNFMLDANGSVVTAFDDDGISNYLSANNSTIGMLNESGSLSNSYSYNSYGSIMNEDSPTSLSKSFNWDGEYRDSDTDLTYLRARWYSPTLMRFVNADTVNVANLYNFGDGNPIDNIDPSGHLPGWVWSIIGGAAAISAVADWWGVGPIALGMRLFGGAGGGAAAAGAAEGVEVAAGAGGAITPGPRLQIIGFAGDIVFDTEIPVGASRLNDISPTEQWYLFQGTRAFSYDEPLANIQLENGIVEMTGMINPDYLAYTAALDASAALDAIAAAFDNETLSALTTRLSTTSDAYWDILPNYGGHASLNSVTRAADSPAGAAYWDAFAAWSYARAARRDARAAYTAVANARTVLKDNRVRNVVAYQG